MDVEQWAMALILLIGPLIFMVFLVGVSIIAVFHSLPAVDARKLMVQQLKYAIYKGAFLPLVVPLTLQQARLWSSWLTVMWMLKLNQALARVHLERLNATNPLTCFDISSAFSQYSILWLILFVEKCWILYMIPQSVPSSVYLLLLIEPLCIAFETLQAIVVHGFQLLDIRFHQSAGLLRKWKRVILRDVVFFLDMMSLLMSLGHYVQLWYAHGMAFHLVDAMLLIPIQRLLSEVVKRTWKFITELRMAYGEHV